MRHVEREFLMEIAKGNVDGHTYVNKFGKNSNVDKSTVPQDIIGGGGIYVAPSLDTIHNIKSTDANDKGLLVSSGSVSSYSFDTREFRDENADFVADAVAVGDVLVDDTGQDHSIVLVINDLNSLDIEPFHHVSHHNKQDISGNDYRIARPDVGATGVVFTHIKQAQTKEGSFVTEFILMNGTTDVPTVNAVYRIERMHTHGVGSSESAVGEITATSTTGDIVVTAKILAGKGSTEMAFIHVPRGYDAYVLKWSARLTRAGAASDAMCNVDLYSKLWAENNGNKILMGSLNPSVHSPDKETFEVPIHLSQDEDMWAQATEVSDDNSIISVNFTVIFIKHGYGQARGRIINHQTNRVRANVNNRNAAMT